jgi:hypothetical protein
MYRAEFFCFTEGFMTEKSEKFLSFDKFKEKVYKHIGTLETFDEIESGQPFQAENRGCLGFFIIPLMMNISFYGNKKARERWKIKELSEKADSILAQQEIKDLLCAKLDATVVLPIDVAYKLTPVLYGLALEDEEKVPFDSLLFAIICRKITKEGVEKYCGEPPPPKRGSTKAKK